MYKNVDNDLWKRQLIELGHIINVRFDDLESRLSRLENSNSSKHLEMLSSDIRAIEDKQRRLDTRLQFLESQSEPSNRRNGSLPLQEASYLRSEVTSLKRKLDIELLQQDNRNKEMCRIIDQLSNIVLDLDPNVLAKISDENTF